MPEEANTILANGMAKGSSFVQVILAGVGGGTRPNAAGQKPWIDDPLRPNEAYFKNVDVVLANARAHNVNISLTLHHQRWRKLITEDTGRNAFNATDAQQRLANGPCLPGRLGPVSLVCAEPGRRGPQHPTILKRPPVVQPCKALLGQGGGLAPFRIDDGIA